MKCYTIYASTVCNITLLDLPAFSYVTEVKLKWSNSTEFKLMKKITLLNIY